MPRLVGAAKYVYIYIYITIGSLGIFSSAIFFSLCFLCVAMTSVYVPAPITILGRDLSISMLGGGFKHFLIFTPIWGRFPL